MKFLGSRLPRTKRNNALLCLAGLSPAAIHYSVGFLRFYISHRCRHLESCEGLMRKTLLRVFSGATAACGSSSSETKCRIESHLQLTIDTPKIRRRFGEESNSGAKIQQFFQSCKFLDIIFGFL